MDKNVVGKKISRPGSQNRQKPEQAPTLPAVEAEQTAIECSKQVAPAEPAQSPPRAHPKPAGEQPPRPSKDDLSRSNRTTLLPDTRKSHRT